MSEQGREKPGFHAIMMAAALAEEGLADAALEVLRDGAGERRAKPPAVPERRWTAGLAVGTRTNRHRIA